MSFQPPEPEPPAMTASRHTRGAPANLLTLRSLLAGGGGLAAVILLIRALPAVGYRLHLPLWVFYALLIGGGATTYLLGRRVATPRTVRPDLPPGLENVSVRRLALGWLAFANLPMVVLAAVVAWLVVYERLSVALAWAALAFGILWRSVSPSLWNKLVSRFRQP